MPSPAIPQIHKIHHRRLFQHNSLLLRNLVQRHVNARQMLHRQIAYKYPLDLVIPHPPVHPPQKHHQLRPQRKHHSQKRPRRCQHRFPVARSHLTVLLGFPATKTTPPRSPTLRPNPIPTRRKIPHCSAKRSHAHSAAPPESPASAPADCCPRQINPRAPAVPPSASETPYC